MSQYIFKLISKNKNPVTLLIGIFFFNMTKHRGLLNMGVESVQIFIILCIFSAGSIS